MRVLHVLTRAHRRGAETFGVVLHEELVALGQASNIVALAPAPAGHDPVRVRTLGPSPRSPQSLRALRHVAGQHDVVVAHGSSTLAACRLALFGLPTPFVYVNIGDPSHWAASMSRRARVRWMLRGAAAVGAISPTSRDRLVSHLSIAPEKVVFTGNGRREKDFRPAERADRVAARVRFGLDPDVPLAVSVASLSVEKRLDLAIAGVASTADWHLLLVGDGPLEERLRAHAARAAPGRVHFTGSLADVRDAYRAADAALLTSETEGLPGVLIESALMGLPLVARDVGFVSDVVIDGRTGRLISSTDPHTIGLALIEARQQGPQWGRSGRRLALDRFELGTVVTRWQDLLVDVHRSTQSPS